MAPPDTGRQRASRIPLDYFKTPGLWERRKLLATIAAVVAAAAWWTAGVLLGRQDASFHSPGSLASVHHTWESQCSACHADFHAIRDDAIAVRWEGGTPASDQKCETCHQGAEHHPVKQGSEAPGCSSCHQDHQGLQASLLRMDDRACTRCHQAIEQHAAISSIDGETSQMSSLTNVTRFDKEHHPEFASAQKDPGHLKFSHYRHLTPGLVNDPREEKTVWTLAKIADPAQRERYRRPGQHDDQPVQLDCGSCHELDGGDFGAARGREGAAHPPCDPSVPPFVVAWGVPGSLSPPGLPQSLLPARSGGKYMLPITYENQCQACHPLYKAPGVVQHRQTPDEIRTALSRAFADDYLRGAAKLLEKPFVPPEPLPSARPDDETVARAIQGQIETAQKELSQEYCGKCHEPQGIQGVRSLLLDRLGAGGRPEVEQNRPDPFNSLLAFVPTQVPQVWFQHATFDHRAHRALDCRQCHPGAYPDAPQPSRESKDVLIPQRDVCIECHSPPSGSGTAATGGARFDCVECHRYHNGSSPLAGSGAKAGNPARTLSEEEFQIGRPHPARPDGE